MPWFLMGGLFHYLLPAVALLSLAGTALDAQESTPPPPAGATPFRPSDRTESSSRQFVIMGPPPAVRGSFAMYVEQIKEEFLRLLNDKDEWKSGITILVKEAPPDGTAPLFQRSLLLLEEGRRQFQLTLNLGPGFSREAMGEEVLRLLIVERAIRGHPHLASNRNPVPEWLVTGLTGVLHWRREGQPAAEFAAVFRSGACQSPDEVLDTQPENLDTLGRGIFRASSCALVMALMEQPEGLPRLKKFLEAYPGATGNDRELLQRSFPGLAFSDNSLDKWWALQMASLSRPSQFERLTAEESRQSLEQALTFAMEEPPKDAKGSTAKPSLWTRLKSIGKKKEPEPESLESPPPPPGPQPGPVMKQLTLEEFLALKTKDRRQRLAAASRQIEELNRRLHPLFHPVASSFAVLLRELADGKDKGALEQIQNLRLEMGRTVTWSADITAFIDWNAANISGLEEGDFDEYHKAMKNLKSRQHRSDALSRYIDLMEAEWERADREINELLSDP